MAEEKKSDPKAKPGEDPKLTQASGPKEAAKTTLAKSPKETKVKASQEGGKPAQTPTQSDAVSSEKDKQAVPEKQGGSKPEKPTQTAPSPFEKKASTSTGATGSNAAKTAGGSGKSGSETTKSGAPTVPRSQEKAADTSARSQAKAGDRKTGAAAGSSGAAAAPKPNPAKQEAAPKTPEKPSGKAVEKETAVQKNRLFPVVLGGVIAAALGFFAAKSQVLDPYLPASMRSVAAADVETLRSDLDSLAGNLQTGLDSIRAEMADLPPPDLSALEQSVNANGAVAETANQALEGLSAGLSALETRLTALEKQPIDTAVSAEAIAAYERELQAMQDAMANQREEVEALFAQARQAEEEAAALERKTELQSALSGILAAIDSGEPFRPELEAFQAASGADLPDALYAIAGEGAPTLAELQAGFDDAADAALVKARTPAEGSSESVGDFLRRRLGTRSVAPREGTDPDAVLSRAEAALRGGELGQMFTELDVLDDAVRAEMGVWLDQARARFAARTAVRDLAQAIETN